MPTEQTKMIRHFSYMIENHGVEDAVNYYMDHNPGFHDAVLVTVLQWYFTASQTQNKQLMALIEPSVHTRVAHLLVLAEDDEDL